MLIDPDWKAPLGLDAACNSGVDIDRVLVPNPDGSANVAIAPQASGGLAVFRTLDLQPAGANVKQARGQLYGWYLSNHNTATSRYVKFYDKVGAGSTDTPFMTFELTPGAVANMLIPLGIPFMNALSVRGTVNVADSDASAPGANEIVCNLYYW